MKQPLSLLFGLALALPLCIGCQTADSDPTGVSDPTSAAVRQVLPDGGRRDGGRHDEGHHDGGHRDGDRHDGGHYDDDRPDGGHHDGGHHDDRPDGGVPDPGHHPRPIEH